MMTAYKITGMTKKELTAMFRQTKKDVSPWLDGYKMGDIDVRWWVKPPQHQSRNMGIGGKCFKGMWKIRLNGRTQYVKNLILIDSRWSERTLNEVVDIWKHELIHLVKQTKGHDRIFKNLIRACGSTMYHSFND